MTRQGRQVTRPRYAPSDRMHARGAARPVPKGIDYATLPEYFWRAHRSCATAIFDAGEDALLADTKTAGTRPERG